MMKKIFGFLVISLLIMMVGTSIVPALADGPDAIVINNNSDFVSFADSGDGSSGNPYIISNKVISSYGGYGIYIHGTDAYCIFENITIVGNSPGYGIYLEQVSNVNFTTGYLSYQGNGILVDNCSTIAIDNFAIEDSRDYGVRIDASDNVAVLNSNFSNCGDGIQLWNSFRVVIRNNQFMGTGLSFYGTCQVSTSVVVADNTVNGFPLGYLYNEHDKQIDISGYGQAILVGCTNITLYNGDISNTNIGVQFIFSQNCIIAYSTISNNFHGILLYESSYNRIYANNVTENVHGVLGYFSIGTVINENNYINNTGYGVWLWYGCSSSSIYLNNFIDNNLGNARDDGGIEDSSLTWVAARFVNAKSGWPLSNVSILVERAGRSYEGWTNENGLIKVPVPVFGTYDLTITKFRYQSIITSVYIGQSGIHLFNVDMDKADIGPGNGYVEMRFMDGTTPVEGASVKVYSYLDGAYYFHSQHTTMTGGYAGSVNITGLYYDNYTVLVEHPDYEDKVIQQLVLPTSMGGSYPYVGTFSNIQMATNPMDAFVHGYVYDALNELPIEGVNLTIYSEFRGSRTVFTDSNGFYNMTNILFDIYTVEISAAGYDTEYTSLVIDAGGSYHGNPVIFYLLNSSYVPIGPDSFVVNNWDNEERGNYWDDYGGIVVLSDVGGYEIFGENLDNPIDQYPLLEPFVRNATIQETIQELILLDSLLLISVLVIMGTTVLVFVSRKYIKGE
jgi:parallel beta-helix repeat protein